MRQSLVELVYFTQPPAACKSKKRRSLISYTDKMNEMRCYDGHCARANYYRTVYSLHASIHVATCTGLWTARHCIKSSNWWTHFSHSRSSTSVIVASPSPSPLLFSFMAGFADNRCKKKFQQIEMLRSCICWRVNTVACAEKRPFTRTIANRESEKRTGRHGEAFWGHQEYWTKTCNLWVVLCKSYWTLLHTTFKIKTVKQPSFQRRNAYGKIDCRSWTAYLDFELKNHRYSVTILNFRRFSSIATGSDRVRNNLSLMLIRKKTLPLPLPGFVKVRRQRTCAAESLIAIRSLVRRERSKMLRTSEFANWILKP